jgi:hypothetical protein
MKLFVLIIIIVFISNTVMSGCDESGDREIFKRVYQLKGHDIHVNIGQSYC